MENDIHNKMIQYALRGTKIPEERFAEELQDSRIRSNAAMNDNNITGIVLPIKINKNEEYLEELKNVYEKYKNEIRKPAFSQETGLVSEIDNTCDSIIDILDNLIEGDTCVAERHLKDMIEEFSKHPFFVNELDKSYSFRGLAPYPDLQVEGYEDRYREMLNQELSFFRVRTKEKSDEKTDISKLKDIVHLPYRMRKCASDTRFSSKEFPCLYLGTTTYVCCKECGWDASREEMFASSFIPNEQGKKLKILNLTIPQSLINGIYNKGCDKPEIKAELQVMMLKIYPLVIATSFSISEENRKIKNEYLISQALMRVIKNMKIEEKDGKGGIDGIAYLSMKGKNEFQYPQGVNLALPAWDITEEKQYGSICDKFDISLPAKFWRLRKTSYINSIYTKEGECRSIREDYTAKLEVDGLLTYYGDTQYAKFDNYLVSRPQYKFDPDCKYRE